MTTSINLVNTGTNANDGTGDSIRTAFQTYNNNFSYLSQYTIAPITANNTSIIVSSSGITVNGSAVANNFTRKLVINGTGVFSNVYINIATSSISDTQELRITSMVPISNVWIHQIGLSNSIPWTSNSVFSNGNATVGLTYVASNNSWMTF
jgi:hypothetical protein